MSNSVLTGGDAGQFISYQRPTQQGRQNMKVAPDRDGLVKSQNLPNEVVESGVHDSYEKQALLYFVNPSMGMTGSAPQDPYSIKRDDPLFCFYNQLKSGSGSKTRTHLLSMSPARSSLNNLILPESTRKILAYLLQNNVAPDIIRMVIGDSIKFLGTAQGEYMHLSGVDGDISTSDIACQYKGVQMFRATRDIPLGSRVRMLPPIQEEFLYNNESRFDYDDDRNVRGKLMLEPYIVDETSLHENITKTITELIHDEVPLIEISIAAGEANAKISPYLMLPLVTCSTLLTVACVTVSKMKCINAFLRSALDFAGALVTEDFAIKDWHFNAYQQNIGGRNHATFKYHIENWKKYFEDASGFSAVEYGMYNGAANHDLRINQSQNSIYDNLALLMALSFGLIVQADSRLSTHKSYYWADTFYEKMKKVPQMFKQFENMMNRFKREIIHCVIPNSNAKYHQESLFGTNPANEKGGARAPHHHTFKVAATGDYRFTEKSTPGHFQNLIDLAFTEMIRQLSYFAENHQKYDIKVTGPAKKGGWMTGVMQ